MFASLDSGAVLGIDAYVVHVEVDITSTIPSLTIVGLPDTAVQESRERVRSAIKNSGMEFPLRRMTVNLAPADIKKSGPSFDLPIAIGILAANSEVRDKHIKDGLFVGELALDGSVSPVAGILPIAIRARDDKRPFIVVPYANAREAAVVKGVDVYAVKTLTDVVVLLNDFESVKPFTVDNDTVFSTRATDELDMGEVKGQEHVKRALEVAAAGGHNILMFATVSTDAPFLSDVC